MKLPFYQVDAFTGRVFGGNPAAVCLMDRWPEDEVMQAIAEENNLSETAFLVEKSRGRYLLRWFTPTVEVDLCGHATLASAFTVFSFFDTSLSRVDFETQSGLLSVEKGGEDLLMMEFPSKPPSSVEMPDGLASALGAAPLETHLSRDLLALFPDEASVRRVTPDFQKLKALENAFAVMITAKGDSCDFVSRFFAPSAGINEDPVTGSAHCTLIPFWSERLGKKKMRALQVSKRGGELFCENLGEKVRISGYAALYAKGEIYF